VSTTLKRAAPHRHLQTAVASFETDLRHHSRRLRRVVPDFRAFYQPALEVYSRPFRVARLPGDGAFAQDERRRLLTFNVAGFQLFHAPIDQLERQGAIPPEQAVIARAIANEQLVAHELVHVGQNLSHFEDVQVLKRLAGPQVLALLDVAADASAARLCARIEMLRAQEKGWTRFAWRLQQQLYVMGEFAFKAFKAPADKPHKRQRFLGLTMEAAMTNQALESKRAPRRDAGELPLGTAVFPYFETDGSLMICALDPGLVLWGRPAAVDPDLLRLTCEEIDTAPFAVSVARAKVLLAQVGPLRRQSE
jgi:hypothetical protein